MHEANNISTISAIKRLLEKNNITLKVVDDGCHNGVYSVHLHIDCGLLQMGLVANGKGATQEQAFVSAYGELIERIQSFIIFPNREAFSLPFRTSDKYHYHKLLPFHYAPDEKVVLEGREMELLLPFFDVKNRDIKYLDYRKIEHKCGSNGIAAGSNLKEALLYSIYEIFERYALRLIYDNSLTPPILKKDWVEKYTRIPLSIADCEIEVRDCSCGLGLPVLGVLLRNKSNGDYRFSLCANYNSIEALESAMSEIFQAGQTLRFVHIDNQKMIRMSTDTNLLEQERLKYRNGTNQLPKSFWADSPSYEPVTVLQDDKFDNTSCLKKCIELISDLGHDLYVRDVSYLSFPTVIAFIPGMSEIVDYNGDSWAKKTFGKIYELSLKSHRLPSLSSCELDEFITFQSQFRDPVYTLMFNKNDVWCTGNPHFVLGVISLSANRFSQALYNFDRLLETTVKNASLRSVYNCFRDFANQESIEFLRYKYSPDIVNLVKDCHEKQLWKTMFNLTDCFKCKECRFKSDCVVDDYCLLLDRLMSKYISNCPNQNYWKEILL